ncbi:hypothetical protein TPA0906_63280 [Streptomyces olivaceus]|nr:hypothetical protein TPA0906_63280 [Streptomyces olivaceus]
MRTERRAGAGAGGTRKGMMGRLSFEGTVARGRGGADDAVSSRGWEGRGRGPGTEKWVRSAARRLDGGILRPWAPVFCLVRGVYTTYVQTGFRVADSGYRYKAVFGREYVVDMWESSRIPGQVYDGDLGERSPCGRPIVVGVFHELFGVRKPRSGMPGECATGHTGTA